MNEATSQERLQGPCKLCQKPVTRFLTPYGEVYFAPEEQISHYLEHNYGMYCPDCHANVCVSCLKARNRVTDLTDPQAMLMVGEAEAAGAQAGIFGKYLITRCPACGGGANRAQPVLGGMQKHYQGIADLFAAAMLLKEGQKALEAGNDDQAISVFDRALAINPKMAGIYFCRGILFSLQGQPQRALEDLNQALSLDLDPDYLPLAYKERANAHYNLGHFPEALEDCSRALLRAPEDFLTLFNRALCYMKVGQLQEAIKDLDRALAINPDYDKAWYQRGYIYVQLKDCKRAIADFDQALALNANEANSWFLRGRAHEELGHQEQAVADYRRFLELATHQQADTIETVKKKIAELS